MRVVFRPGASVSATAGEVQRLGLRRVLVVSGARGADTARAVAGSLGELCAGLHAEARMHVPVEPRLVLVLGQRIVGEPPAATVLVG
ncbi:hypothetical protein O3Q52_50125, partial [Streptomyces sp. ActVer]|nr:hypothetical protein [Streptomyces sp. ActVer]